VRSPTSLTTSYFHFFFLRAHEQWGYCQAGVDALLASDGTALIGAPGPFTWRGTTFAFKIGDGEDDFLFRDKTHYYSPVAPADAPVGKYAYLGMAVASGDFLPPHLGCGQKVTYAAGAPRSGQTGEVILLVRCQSEVMRVARVLRGEGFAAQFGYSLAAADLVGEDGYDELVVGAPFYDTSGSIYIYRGGPEGLARDGDRVRLTTPEANNREVRFGYSVATAGDLNNDGLADLAVGSPGHGRGKVFIYMGSTEPWSTEKKADQIISAEEVRSPSLPLHFGFSLSGGLDVDGNNHTDLAVGALGSEHAFILRARPVIDMITWFGERPGRIDPETPGCPEDQQATEHCFIVESCFLLKNFPANIDRTYIRYSLYAEVFPGGRKVSRVRLGNNATSYEATRTVPVVRDSLTGCFLEVAYLRSDAVDFTTPVDFKLSLRLDQDGPGEAAAAINGGEALPNINQFPILNRQHADRTLSVAFKKDCGGDDICTSRLKVGLQVAGLKKEEGDNAHSLEVAERSEVLLSMPISNVEGEPAYAATATLFLDPAFSYIGRTDDASDILCEFMGEKVVCQLGNPYAGGRSDRLSFRVLPKSGRVFGVRHKANFSVSATTTSQDALLNAEARQVTVFFEAIKRQEVSLRSSVQPPEIWYGGRVRGESAMRSLADVGQRLVHTFHVSNDGSWPVGDLELSIDWPHQLSVADRPHLEVGRWLLYLASEPDVTPPSAGRCFVARKMINSLMLRDERASRRPFRLPDVPRHRRRIVEDRWRRRRRKRRRRRDTAKAESRYTNDGGPRLSCSDGGRTRCFVISCRLAGLRPGESAVVRLRSRVWNSTLVEEFSSSPTTHVEVAGRLLLHPETAAAQSNVDDDVSSAVLIARPTLPPGGAAGSVPLWLILMAVLIGLSVLALIGLVLAKLGFFRRQRPTQVTAGGDESEGEDLMISAKMAAANSRGNEYAT